MLFTCQCGRERVSRQEEKQTIKWKMNSHTFSKYQCACLSRLLNFCLDYRNRLIPPLSHVSCLLLLLMPSSSSSCNNNTTLRLWSPGWISISEPPITLLLSCSLEVTRVVIAIILIISGAVVDGWIHKVRVSMLKINVTCITITERYTDGMRGWEVRMDRWHRRYPCLHKHTHKGFLLR